MELDVVVEGVEQPEQEAELRKMGCQHVQGWLYAKGEPNEAFVARLTAQGEPVRSFIRACSAPFRVTRRTQPCTSHCGARPGRIGSPDHPRGSTMTSRSHPLRAPRARKIPVVLAASSLLALAVSAQAATLSGKVESAGTGLGGYRVMLFASTVGRTPAWTFLGQGGSDASGHFQITYATPPAVANQPAVYFVEARRGAVLLASAIGTDADVPGDVVVNERTTVATGNAFAQFIDRETIHGNRYGMTNAVHMAANLADPRTGRVGVVLSSSPNGTGNSTLPTFNSLANAVAACVAGTTNCFQLLAAATPAGGPPPGDVLQAVADIVRHPAYPGYPDTSDPIFRLSQVRPVYRPALAQRPTNWLLFLKITGGFYSTQDADNLFNGPGNFAIDAKGYVWANDNAEPRPEGEFACAGRRLLKFYPWGRNFPGSPYFGGGLSGVGYGITLDPGGNVWVGNFGFQDPPCAFVPDLAAKHDSVSAFRADGTPISPASGFTQGDVSWPQGTVSDRKGNIWVANCGNDSVTRYALGDPARAINIALGPPPAAGQPQIKPFGAVVDGQGNVWINGNRSNAVYVIAPDGTLIDTLGATYQGRTVISHPVGNAADSEGNVWVANSDWLDSPCPTRRELGPATNPSVTMFQTSDRKPYPGSPFTGGGLTLPWGIAVDGDDTVWVFNFGAVTVGRPSDIPTGISRFCGVSTGKCPRGLRVGDPISPGTGYRSDALERITGGEIDPSGNIWLTNNWKRDANPFVNPFGNGIVIAIGAAAPIRTPLIGPPVRAADATTDVPAEAP